MADIGKMNRMKNMAFAIKDAGVWGLLAVLTAHGILRSDSRRSNANGSVKPRGWLNCFDARLWRREMRRQDEYLAQSTDVFDLELRQRALERRR
jgi:hypothetical protein